MMDRDGDVISCGIMTVGISVYQSGGKRALEILMGRQEQAMVNHGENMS